MARTIGDVITQIEARLKGGLKSTPEHQGFVTALGAVAEELGSSSLVLEIPGDKLMVLALDRPALLDVITAELERDDPEEPVGKIKIAQRIIDALGELIGVKASKLTAAATLEYADDAEEEEPEEEGDERARGTIARFEREEGGGDD